jgi:hypothetical protein
VHQIVHFRSFNDTTIALPNDTTIALPEHKMLFDFVGCDTACKQVSLVDFGISLIVARSSDKIILR